MTEYKNERNHKKLMVPIIALILCAAAMVGLGYAALTSSTATNTDNVVGAEGLVVKLVDEEDNLLTANGFSGYTGVSIIEYSSIQNNDGIEYKIDTFGNLVLGGAKLNIHVDDPNIEEVKMYYEITWGDGVDAPYGITTSLNVAGMIVNGTADSDSPVTITLDAAAAHSEDGQDFALVLNGNMPIINELSENPPEQLKYNITIYVLL